MSLALILAGAQLGMGAYQYIKGQSEQKNLKRPIYNIPDEVKANMTDAQLRALEGLPEEQKKAYVSQIQQAAGAQANRASNMKSGLVGMSGVYQNQINAYQQLLGADAQARQQNQQQLTQARGAMAQYKDKAFLTNQMEPYKQAYNQAQAMQGAGLQNAMGALQQGAGSLDQMQAQKMQMDYLKEINKGKTDPNFGKNYTSPPLEQQTDFSKYISPEIPLTGPPRQDQWMQQQNAQQVGYNNMYGVGPTYDPNFLGNADPGNPFIVQQQPKYNYSPRPNTYLPY